MAVAELDISSEPTQLSGVREFVAAFCREELPFDDDQIGQLELAVNEAVANIMRHAHRGSAEMPIHITANAENGEVKLQFYYGGDAFDPTGAAPPAFDGSREGGFGLYMIARSVDEVVYSRDVDGTNCICLVKSLPSAVTAVTQSPLR